MDDVGKDHIKAALEALLFVSDKPVSMEQFKSVIPGISAVQIKEVLKVLMEEYSRPDRGMTIMEIANGYQMLSSSNMASYIREFYKTCQKERLSRPALEVLAIVAYKQPVSRTDIEVLRGVNSDGIVVHLLNKGLVKISGRKEIPGRPFVYATTTRFLEFFGLRALEDLPKLEDFPAMAATGSSAGAESSTVTFEPAPSEQERILSDIEEIEKNPEVVDGFLEPGQSGESSGQARLMSDNASEPLQQEKDHGIDPAS